MEDASNTAIDTPVPDWLQWSNLYEVNLRQYTPEGTFAAFRNHLPRLRDMGVDILWFMPVQPVSRERRKGPMGSPYALSDYLATNPDFGSFEEFCQLVEEIHRLGMRVILDWVPNHTGWDHSWIREHPDWYIRGDSGKIIDPVNPVTGESWGWTDVAALDYGNPEMRQAMIDAMTYWVRESGIDGFRADVAHGVPVDFWEECTRTLYAIRPLFMLAEAEDSELVNSGYFTADYGWDMHHLFNEIAKSLGGAAGGRQLDQGNIAASPGEDSTATADALEIDRQLSRQAERYRRGLKMYFTSNHDENAWAGTEFRRMGAAHLVFAVIAATLRGIPLVYSGQEAAMDRQLAFFEKDEISWGDYPYTDFYKALNELRHRNRALWNTEGGGRVVKIPTGVDRWVYAFTRGFETDRVVVVLNLSTHPREAVLGGLGYSGEYKRIFGGQSGFLGPGDTLVLEPLEYRVYSNR
ncbi:alpha-amylase family glycosyl hydrolase [Robiginitalea biformata]|uniref:Alpha-amylase, putative n=1 Tax=Robiginitalea biformata (strain ATCC BAA-864 / DSM 15991 / KCTC 12146 / HTCC2501) TaxID=313596 RepID=A4CNE0_ROBBH|nr:alpha-amylase family glycosyl hydrolase [Robiginitalea biformata]EAR15182.1 alpha-amylase, putative [Robiginitalea biformata HTCC2501]